MTVIDTTLNTFVGAPIRTGNRPTGVGVDPTVHRAYVANQFDDSVLVIDTTTNTALPGLLATEHLPTGVGVDPTGHFAVVTNQNSNSVSVIDTTTNRVQYVVPVGTSPKGVGFGP